MNGKRTKLRIWEFGRSVRGSAAAEFALCLPLLILIMFAVIEFGRGLHDFQVVTETVRDAARYLGRSPVDCAGAAAGCGTCNDTGDCGPCDFIDSGGVTAEERIDNALAIAMTGDLDGASGAENLLGYWTDSNTITVEICRIDNTAGGFTSGGFAGDLTGIYFHIVIDGDGNEIEVPDSIIPHVRLSADVPFTFMFGALVSPIPTLEFSLSHNVVMTGR